MASNNSLMVDGADGPQPCERPEQLLSVRAVRGSASHYMAFIGIAAELIRDVGFDPVDAGPLRIARYTEPFALLIGQLAYLLERGDRVVGTVRDTGKVADLIKRYPATFHTEVLDVTDAAAIREVVERSFAQFKRIDVIIVKSTRNANRVSLQSLNEPSRSPYVR